MRIRIASIIFTGLVLMLVGVISACIPASINEFENEPEDESEQWVLLEIRQPENLEPSAPLESVIIDKRDYAAVIMLRYETWHEFVFSVSAPANIGPGETVSFLFTPTIIKNIPELTTIYSFQSKVVGPLDKCWLIQNSGDCSGTWYSNPITVPIYRVCFCFCRCFCTHRFPP